jgi:PAS domain S-box-containing protein
LQEQQRMLSTLMSNLPGMVYRCKNDADWTMMFVSEGSFELTGYRPDELVNNAVVSFASLILDTDRQRVWDEVQAALAQRQPYTLEYRIRHRSGRELWVWERGRGVFSDNGELLALEGIINDISERKWAEGKIFQLGKMLDNANDAVSAVDEHFKLTYWNAAAERLYGWKKEEVLGKEIAEVVKIEYHRYNTGGSSGNTSNRCSMAW